MPKSHKKTKKNIRKHLRLKSKKILSLKSPSINSRISKVNNKLESNLDKNLSKTGLTIPDRTKVFAFLKKFGPTLLFTMAQTLAELNISWDEYLAMYPGYIQTLQIPDSITGNNNTNKRDYEISHSAGPLNMVKLTHRELFTNKKNV
jgi:hypothetical protein